MGKGVQINNLTTISNCAIDCFDSVDMYVGTHEYVTITYKHNQLYDKVNVPVDILT